MLVRDTGEKIQILGEKAMISMNPITGHSYYIERDNYIRDITYGCSLYRKLIKESIKNEKDFHKVYIWLTKQIKGIYKERNVPTLKANITSFDNEQGRNFYTINKIEDLILSLRYPQFVNKNEFSGQYGILTQIRYNKDFRQINPLDNIDDIFYKFNITAKNKIIKGLRDNFGAVTILPCLSVFEKPDNQIKYFNFYNKWRISVFSKESRLFLKEYLKYHDENQVVKKLENVNWRYYDTARMFYDFKSHKYKIDKDILKEKNLDRIHDAFIAERKLVSEKDFVEPFSYTNKIKTLEAEVNGIKFWLPKSPRELQQIGNKMGNCIGGYGNSIRSGSEHIIIMDDCRAATSFRGKKIVQAFARYNENMDAKYLDAFNKWCEINGMDNADYWGRHDNNEIAF